MEDIVKAIAQIIKEQIIETACEDGITDFILEGVIREEIVPLVQKMERERTERMRIITITSCVDCPYSKLTLRGNKRKGGLVYCGVEGKKVAHFYDITAGNIIPDWCPRRH
ncbi:MAG: hypothetical protein DRI01_08525 [Chloroflexi bacterium]|nr:MAG: hypothetical protein DRI01_08525 [Chloroflexota bacterium]